MLHQRTTRRQQGGADMDALDPTTTVYGTSSSSGGYSTGGGHAYGGYSGYGHTPATPMYGNSSSNGASLYNDKNKKKKSSSFINAVLQKLQDPFFIVTMIAIICFLFAVRYKLAHQHVYRNIVKGDLHHVSRQRDELQRQLETAKEAHKKQTLEAKKFQTELVKLKSNVKNGKDIVSDEAVTKLETREKAWKKQYELLKEAVIKESRRSVLDKYGNPPYYCEFTVSIAVQNEHDADADYDEVIKTFTIEMAPLEEMPHAVHLFLEQVAHKLWDNGWFYLNGPHVFQAGPQVPDDEEYETLLEKGADERTLALKPFKDLQLDRLAFPEYSDKFPHLPWTLGFTGRPGGPDFYINKVDNIKAHGPGGQTHHDLVEHADPCFAKIIAGMDTIAMMTNAPTIRTPGDSHRFFFEEPVQIIKVRIVQHPSKLVNLSKIAAAALGESKNEGQQHSQSATINTETGTTDAGKTDNVEMTTGNVKVPEPGKPTESQEHYEEVEHDYKFHNDEEHSEHHRQRHRKHPNLTNILPEHTVEA